MMRLIPLPLLVIVLLGTEARATIASSVTIDPAVIEIEGTPGTAVERSIVLTNNLPWDVDVEVVAEDVVIRDGVRTYVPTGETRGGIAASIIARPRKLRIGTGARATVTAIVTAPEARSQSAAALFFRAVPIQQDVSSGVRINIGCLIVLQQGDDPLLEFERPSIDSEGTLTQTIENRGGDIAIVRGTVRLLEDSLDQLVQLPSVRLLPGERYAWITRLPAPLRHARPIATEISGDRGSWQSEWFASVPPGAVQ